jgi:hypothetical protein
MDHGLLMNDRRISRRALLASLGGVGGLLALGIPDARAADAPLRIGIIGTGKIGTALARHWARAGHELMLSSRHPEQLQPLAKELGPRVQAGTPQQAARFGTVIFIAVPYSAMPQLGQDLKADLAGKILIDASNPREQRDGPMAADAARKGAGVATAEYLGNRRVVRAFDCINYALITSESDRKPARRVIPIGGDDAAALDVARRLISDAGFDSFVVGSLARTRDFDLDQPLASKDWTAAQYQQQLAK